jgi:hypothetical protein
MSIYAAHVRQEISRCAAEYGQNNSIAFRRSHEQFGSGVFVPESGAFRHGNFYPASYRAIIRRPIWRARFRKALTVPDRLRRADDEHRICELDSCCSSDALLMNIFCHREVRRSSAVLGMMGIYQSAIPIFGWRARIPLEGEKFDRTEVDMKFGSLLVEAKLTEPSFESCPLAQMKAYKNFETIFRRAELRRTHKQYHGYQLLRNVLAAHHHRVGFCLLTDARRKDLIEAWYEILRAIRPVDLRVRCKLLTWQELAEVLPNSLRRFLALKYGIEPGVAASHSAVGY